MKQTMPIPLIEASTALQAAIEKKTALQTKLNELEAERNATQDKINLDRENRNKADHVMSEAELILAGNSKARDFVPRLEVLHSEIRTIRQALALQEREVASVRASEGARLGAQYRPAYAEHCKRIAAILQDLAPALEAEYQYRRAMIDADFPVHTMGEIFAVTWLGRPGDNFSNINRLLKLAREHEYLAE